MDPFQPSDALLGLSQRLPPSNLQAEQALLGALLANGAAFERVAEFLRPHHFADPVHGRIFGAISRRLNNGQIADPITLRQEFEHSGVLDEVGGTAYLAQLLAAMVGIINAGDYGRAILDAWMRRELIDICEQTVNACFGSGEKDAHGILEDIDAAITRVADNAGDVRPMVSAGEAVKRAVELAAAASERKSGLAGITTGYAALDKILGGFLPGQMYLLGARPAMGKSGLGLGIAARAASAGLRVLMWSGEMAAPQLGARLAAAHARIDVMSVFRGKAWTLPDGVTPGGESLEVLPPDDWHKLVYSQREAQKLKLQFDDRAGVTVGALRARARRLKRTKKLDLVVVDHIGLMRGSPVAEKQKLYEKMTEISSDLAKLAAELEVPILVMAQLNRDVEKREHKMPQLSDLRDSGGLEQDAYAVMFLHRPYYYLVQAGEPQKGPKETNEAFADRASAYHHECSKTFDLALVNIAKHRNGATGIRRLRFHAETIWFRDESEERDSPAWGMDLLGGA